MHVITALSFTRESFSSNENMIASFQLEHLPQRSSRSAGSLTRHITFWRTPVIQCKPSWQFVIELVMVQLRLGRRCSNLSVHLQLSASLVIKKD